MPQQCFWGLAAYLEGLHWDLILRRSVQSICQQEHDLCIIPTSSHFLITKYPGTCNTGSLKFLTQLSWFPHQSFQAGDLASVRLSRQNLATEGEKDGRKTLVRPRCPAALLCLLWPGLPGLPVLVLSTTTLTGRACTLLSIPAPAQRNVSLLPAQLLI